jgi:hypothetical protein
LTQGLFHYLLNVMRFSLSLPAAVVAAIKPDMKKVSHLISKL